MEPRIQWPELLAALLASGLTQQRIAAIAECSQSTISDLRRGETTDPRTSIGRRLLRLAEQRGIADSEGRVIPARDPQITAYGRAAGTANSGEVTHAS